MCYLLFFIVSVFLHVYSVSAHAQDFTVNGHLRGQGSLSYYPDEDFISKIEERQLFIDASIDGRLNVILFLTDSLSIDFAYEAGMTGGQTRKALSKVGRQGDSSSFSVGNIPSDDGQLFSLTKIVSEDDNHIVYHRIDRLAVNFDYDYGTFRVGRQALTWGNGMVFNPADVINPFSPTDIIRDYKIGADMLLYQIGGRAISDFQLVYVPRRNENNEISWAESTIGTKIRFSFDETDTDLYGSKNYGDYLIGAGLTGYLGGAVYRSDVTLTFLENDEGDDNYLSAVVNLDYSWVYNNQNWYGMVEIYYNGLGYSNAMDALQDQNLQSRLVRGELFVTGRWYFDAMVQYEIHPLVNSFISVIYNLEDQSFLIQPRIVWDFTQSTQLLAGGNLPIGNPGDEFGSSKDPVTGEKSSRGIQFYMLMTWFF